LHGALFVAIFTAVSTVLRLLRTNNSWTILFIKKCNRRHQSSAEEEEEGEKKKKEEEHKYLFIANNTGTAGGGAPVPVPVLPVRYNRYGTR
jgi:hypothetical protein